MDTVIPGLYASASEPLSFDPSLEIRAFLLQHNQGNLLVYSAGTLEADVYAIEDLGGSLCHENERRPVLGTCNVDAILECVQRGEDQ
jgi:hypothetical protein